LKVTVVFFAALELFSVNVGAAAPAGTVVACQKYLRVLSPASSAPKTESFTVLPATELELAVATEETVGALLTAPTLTVGWGAGIPAEEDASIS
jgi:hypothetical protein